MDIEWVREIRDQCGARSVAFYFKRWGGPRPKTSATSLDGREWKEFPIAPIDEKAAA
jgi:protein gp37